MKIYLVKWTQKDGGYSHGDECVSGGYYDVHGHEIVTASSGAKAVAAIEVMRPNCKVNKRPKILGEA